MDWQGLIVALLQVLGGGAFAALVVTIARNAVARIPRVLVLPLALVVGVVAEWLAAQVTGGQLSPIRAVALGTAATWLREFVSTARQHGTSA